MEIQRLPNHDHYYHTHSDFFMYPQDLVHAFVMKDYDIGMHEQEFYEINVVINGNGLHYINDNRVSASSGDVFIIPPNVSHGYVGGVGFDVFHVILSDSFMNKNIADLQQLPSFFTLFGAEPLMRGQTKDPLHLTLSPDKLGECINTLKQIEHYSKFNNPFESLMRSSLAAVSIGLLCNSYTNTYKQSDFSLCEDRALMESISYIHERYFEKITVEDLSRLAHMSRSSFIKKFKDICKISPAAYLTKIRINSAVTMLLNTTLPVSEIAYRTGFYDASHLTKAFENTFGLSPIAYKNKQIETRNH